MHGSKAANALTPVMSADEVNAFLKVVYPQLNEDFAAYYTTEVFPGGCTVRLDADNRHLRGEPRHCLRASGGAFSSKTRRR